MTTPGLHLRLTKRGRAALVVLVVLPVAAIVILGLDGGDATASRAGAGLQGTGFEYVTVEPGESLWSIAEERAPESDPRDVIAGVIELNRLDSAEVFAGQEIAFPIPVSG